MVDILKSYVSEYMEKRKMAIFRKRLEGFLRQNWNYRWVVSHPEAYEARYNCLAKEMEIDEVEGAKIYIELLSKYLDKFFAEQMKEMADPEALRYVKRFLKIY